MTKINDYIIDINNFERKWKNYVVDPYCLAYIDAYHSYTKILKKQNELEKKQAEFATLALTLMGGSVLTVLFRNSSLNNALKESSIEVMFRSNSRNLLNIAVAIEDSPTTKFILSSVIEESSKKTKEHIKNGIKKSMKNIIKEGSYLQPKLPLEINIQFKHYVTEIAIQATDFAIWVRENNIIPDDVKDLIAIQLMKSRFSNPPNHPPFVGRKQRADEIELLYYMNLILNSDFLRTTTGTASRGGASLSSINHGAIKALPSSRNYPTDSTHVSYKGGYNFLGVHIGRSATRTSRGAGYERIGILIRNRINELYNLKTREQFYQLDGKYKYDVMGHEEMLRAEKMIRMLAYKNGIRI